MSQNAVSDGTGKSDLTDFRPIKARIGLKSNRAFWQLVYAQGMPHYRLNARVIRFRWSEVEQWLAEHKKGGAL